MRSTAERTGHDPKIAEAMVDDRVEIARVVRDQGKGAIYVASELLEKKPS